MLELQWQKSAPVPVPNTELARRFWLGNPSDEVRKPSDKIYLHAASNPAAPDATTTTGAVSGALRMSSEMVDAVEAAVAVAEDTALLMAFIAESVAGGEDILAFFFFFMRPTDDVSYQILMYIL